MMRIYADFNSRDEQGRVWLNTVGSLEDLEKYRNIVSEGMRVILYMPDVEVCGTLIFDDETWKGIPDWSTIHYPEETPEE